VAESGTVTIGVLGGSSWIANGAVIPAIDASTRATVGSIGSRSGPLSYDDVLADPSNDAVYIPLPNGMHRHWVERAAAAGKHVLCEKPLAASSVDVRAMIAACDAAGVLLAEAYMSPFHPRSIEIARRLDGGDLGEVRHAEAAFTFPLADAPNYRWEPEQGGGALLDVGIYCLSPVVRAHGGPPSSVNADAITSASGIDATTSVRLVWPGGGTASVLTSFELPERQWLHVAGTGGSLAVHRPYTPGFDDVSFEIVRPDGSVERHTTDGGNCYVGMVDAFAGAVLGDAVWPRSATEVLAITELCELIASEAVRR
jgi:D-xylose 1-dehydrogenase (NADP+, D-xylono-1,5-lactone-forming)